MLLIKRLSEWNCGTKLIDRGSTSNARFRKLCMTRKSFEKPILSRVKSQRIILHNNRVSTSNLFSAIAGLQGWKHRVCVTTRERYNRFLLRCNCHFTTYDLWSEFAYGFLLFSSEINLLAKISAFFAIPINSHISN